jgi:2-polyprenyl-6-methoxyphenol hydroxylase-like FAD-dependent oxidoreductase
MSPFGGDGANLTMQDGAELALMQREDWRVAIPVYEDAMFARVEPAAAGAWDAIDEVFSEDGLAHILQSMREHRGEDSVSNGN